MLSGGVHMQRNIWIILLIFILFGCGGLAVSADRMDSTSGHDLYTKVLANNNKYVNQGSSEPDVETNPSALSSMENVPDVCSSSPGSWMDISMPATITCPGYYRISNDYTALNTSETGVTIVSSNVILDGNGHTFFGNDLSETKGVVVQSDSNSTYQGVVIQNFRTNQSWRGIVYAALSGAIYNTTHTGGRVGIQASGDNNQIIGNVVQNQRSGIKILGTNYTVQNNQVYNTTICFDIQGYTLPHFLHHIDRSNLVDGKPIVYYSNQSDFTVQTDTEPAMIIIANCRNVTVQNISVNNSYIGYQFVWDNQIHIENISDARSMYGMVALSVQNGSFSNSSFIGNWDGTDIQDGVNLSFSNISIKNPTLSGLWIYNSTPITITGSSVKDARSDLYPYPIPGIMASGCDKVDIKKSSVSNTSDFGIGISNSSHVILDDVLVTKNGLLSSEWSYFDKAGIAIQNTFDFSVKNSRITHNYDGLFLRNVTIGNISGNTISENQQSGLIANTITNTILYNNIFNNSANVLIDQYSQNNIWNISLTSGTNIVGGPNLGGNFWATPNSTGFSQTHADRGDGICTGSFTLAPGQTDYLPLAVWSHPLTAGFDGNVTQGVPPLSVLFTDTSSGQPTHWNWNFGDGSVSHEQNPVHTYSGIGRYTVTLEVTDSTGRSDIIRKPGFIVTNGGRVSGPNGMIWISSTPSDALVYVDGAYLGVTPLQSVGVPAGIRQVHVTKDGYHDWTGYVQVRQGVFSYVPKVVLWPN
ncbi:hypothetical protein DK846_06315 [Methanospirillum lacunae]|uniref:PKD domain-containing protein n=2 Tax=Methanospirillum lacunae TaxID=668570 RepID=A0A2V2N8H0_9EURY|nr:hypothetical protein DK846_06315 [Methanospirillum lacunae]